jgi:hypothetical protein
VSPEAPTRDRKATPFGRVAVVFVALIALGVAVAMIMHRTFVAADRVVAQHVSADAGAVVRVDLEKATLFAPVRRFLLPLLDGETGAPGTTRWERVAARSQLVVGRDTREALALWGPGENDWAIVLGGNYPDGALGALSEVFREEGKPWRKDNGRLVAPSGHAIAQASDRTLLLASDSERLQKVLPATDDHLRFGVPLKGAFAFVGVPQQVPWLAQALGPLGQATRVTAKADWSSPLVVHLHLTFAGAPPSGTEALVRDRFRELVGTDEAGRLEHVVGALDVETRDRGLVVTTRWDHKALERLAERLAAVLRQQGPSAHGKTLGF